eukprot:scaffold23606_cov108-Isochrysis_galbana.AAC.5
MVECLPARDVVHQQRARRASIIRSRDRAEGFLSGRVPNLQLDLFPIQGDHPRPEFNADGKIMHL